MNVFHSAADLNPGSRPVFAAIGFFDGVHLGHQEVLRRIVFDARQAQGVSVAITFDRHPATTVSPHHAPGLVYPIAKKLAVLESLGIDAVFLIRFDKAASEVGAEAFVRGLARDFKSLKSVCVGGGFTFGHGRSGNVTLLKTLGRELGFTVFSLVKSALDGRTISSTRVREAVRSGHFDAAAHLLGRPYAMVGPVVEGDRIGRAMGFPTANLDASGLVLPPCGVYAANVSVQGQPHPAVVNIGHRPTLKSPAPQLRVEAHLLDINSDLYSQTIEIAFIQKLRDEQKFPSLEALKNQIQSDVSSARRVFLPASNG